MMLNISRALRRSLLLGLLLTTGAALAGNYDSAQGELQALQAAAPQPLAGAQASKVAGFEEMALFLSDPAGGSASYASTYSEAGLLLLVDVQDPTPLQNAGDPAQHTGRNGDAVCLHLDPRATGKAADLVHVTCWINHAQKKVNWELERGTGKYVAEPGVQVAMKPNALGTGYTCALLLPWKALGMMAKPAQDTRWPALLEVIFGDEQGTQAQAGIIGVARGAGKPDPLNSTAEWGTLVFTGAQSTKPAHTPLVELAQQVLVDGARMNGSFEKEGLAPWFTGFYGNFASKDTQKITAEKQAAFTRDGATCLKFQVAGDQGGRRSQGGIYLNLNNLDLSRGRTFVLTYDARAGETPFFGVATEVLFFDKQNQLVKTLQAKAEMARPVADRWMTARHSVTLPDTVQTADLKYAQVRIVYFVDGGDAAKLYQGYLDNVMVRQEKAQ